MYAVVASGGKQYRVQEGDTLKIEKIPGDVGTDVAFDQVLMVSDGDDVKIGQPVLENAVVNGTIIEQGKGRKILVFKYKRRNAEAQVLSRCREVRDRWQVNKPY